MNSRPLTLRAPGMQRGFTLVELMVAAVISLILMAGIIHVYTGSKATYRVEEGLSRLQENGRFALELMSRRIRMAAFQGCSNLNELTPRNVIASPPANLLFTPDEITRGIDNIDDVAEGSGYGADYDPDNVGARVNTDVLIIRGASPDATSLASDMATDTADILLAANPNQFTVGDFLLVTDCESADIIEVTGPAPTTPPTPPGNTLEYTGKLSKPYLQNAAVQRFESTIYFLMAARNPDDPSRPLRRNQAGDQIYSLFRTNLNDTTTELIEGVEDMQITYGVDTTADGSADLYQDASAVADWSTVVSVRLGLLLATTEHVSPVAQGYTDLAGAQVAAVASDRRLRRRFTTTISLRNRAL